MKSEIALLVATLLSFPQPLSQYRAALPDYHYEFPRDHFNHPDFQTEWWYYTGNLRSTDGHRFGFELTFFREGISRSLKDSSAWDVRDLYLAHLALSDLDGGRFYQNERTNRAGPGIAGVSETDRRIWNGNWRIQWRGEEQELEAVDERFTLRFALHSAKPPVIQGERGVSQKAEGRGRASQYISLTRLLTSGQIEMSGTKFNVTGLAWMDHEFFTSQLAPNQVGWDWLSIQLDDNTELMVFDIRCKDGSIDPHSSGTFVDSVGRSAHLRETDFSLVATGATWTSPATQATYPVHWRISIPKLNMELDAATTLPSQELTGKSRLIPNYWEGAIRVAGHKGPSATAGYGYLEMTGYDRPLAFQP
jgi:predicted secreted hydrolase